MEINDIIRPENKVYSKPQLLDEVHMHYCPGCSHGVIHKLVAEVVAERVKLFGKMGQGFDLCHIRTDRACPYQGYPSAFAFRSR